MRKFLLKTTNLDHHDIDLKFLIHSVILFYSYFVRHIKTFVSTLKFWVQSEKNGNGIKIRKN